MGKDTKKSNLFRRNKNKKIDKEQNSIEVESTVDADILDENISDQQADSTSKALEDTPKNNEETTTTESNSDVLDATTNEDLGTLKEAPTAQEGEDIKPEESADKEAEEHILGSQEAGTNSENESTNSSKEHANDDSKEIDGEKEEASEDTKIDTEEKEADEIGKASEDTKIDTEEKSAEEINEASEEPEEEVDLAKIEQEEKEQAERLKKEQEEEQAERERMLAEQRKRDEEWEKEKARLAEERRLKREKLLQDSLDSADRLEKMLDQEGLHEGLEDEIEIAKGLLEKLEIEIESPWVEEFKAETTHEKSEEAKAEALIAEARVIIAEVEKMREEMKSAIPDDLEEDYYLSSDEESSDIAEQMSFKVHKPDDDLEGQEVQDEEVTEDEIERAYDVGVGQELDDYDREILDPIFENYLRMSINSLKYRYSKIKNEIMSYSQMTHSFDGMFENFRISRNVILRLSVSNDKLFLYCALPLASIDKKVYPHKKAVGTHGKITPTVLTIQDEKSLQNAIEIIAVVMAKHNVVQKKHFVPSAYAERYPLNPNAVILGYEHIPPIEGQYDDEFEYDPITGEIVDGIIKAKVKRLDEFQDLTGKAKLEDLRQTAKTIKASVAMTEPIVYFYDAATDITNNVQYVNIQQVLNDKFFGKIVPQSYFAVAEGSDRIETLNFLALQHAIETANANPNMRFVLALSARLLLREKVFERLLRNVKTEHDNLVLAFDCALLESIGDIGLNAITKLRNECSAMIMIDNAENAGMKVLTEYDYEYLRFDSRYYLQDSPRQQAHLQMLAGYCKTQNIRSTSINVPNTKEAQNLIRLGVEIVQGYAVSEPKRNLNQAIRNIKKIPPI